MKIPLSCSLLLLAGCAAPKEVQLGKIVPPTSAPRRAVKPTPVPAPVEPRAVEFSPDFKWLALGTLQRHVLTTTGTVEVRDVATNRVVKKWTVAEGVRNLAFSPDGKTLAVSDAKSTLSIWEWKTARLRHRETFKVEFENGRTPSLAFSPDGRTLAVGLERVELLDTAQWKRKKIPLPSGLPVLYSDVIFSPDGRFLLATDSFEGYGEGYGGYTFIDSRTGKVRNTSGFISGRATVSSPDGRSAAGSGQGLESLNFVESAIVWNTRNLKIRQQFRSEEFQPEAFSPDARFVAGLRVENYTGESDKGRVEIWSVASGKRVRVFPQSARRVVWSDPKTLLLGAENGARRLKLN